KDKSQNTKEINNGLFTYPVLMAADILLYQADLVPVGEDQKQHLELTRDLAEKFNRIYCGVTPENKKEGDFKIPEPFIGKKGARIMSLQDPTKKMSKSDENPKSYVSIIDSPKKISKKIKAAVTDSDPEAKVIYDTENKVGLANLMVIYSVLTGDSFDKIKKDFEGKMYGHFKVALAEIVCEAFRPAQEKYEQLMNDQTYLKSVMKKNAERASERASQTLKKVYDSLGLVSY
ncbi:MAG: tryptophan--tRNA ligase, partial [Bdellovibrionales bacterium]|nr:tryptophan--tRNA ligase [Bdellovibrionales bacterium]NQZ20070.1 tryptophan--tRNA ligase [Bdellovibrionales bacterium]